MAHSVPTFVTQEQPVSIVTWRPVARGSFGDFYYARSAHIVAKGFSILTLELKEALIDLTKGRLVVEVGCGTGYLASQIGVVGIDNYATKYCLGKGEQPLRQDRNVKELDATTMDLSAYDDIIMSWPDYREPFASTIAKRMRQGQRLFYCGELEGGCTADEEFFEVLSKDFVELEAETERLQDTAIQFQGIHDDWTVYERQ